MITAYDPQKGTWPDTSLAMIMDFHTIFVAFVWMGSLFAYVVSPEGLVSVSILIGSDEEVVRGGATVYNVEKDEWKCLPAMNQERDD